MNIQIVPGAALDDAKQIDTIVSEMDDAMNKLNQIITNQMGPVGSGKDISTNWAEVVVNNWKKYYTTDIPEAMNQMKQSASNLRMAVDAALAYSNNN